MKVYTVRKDDTPEKIAQGFTGRRDRFGELVRANPQLRTKIVGRDMQTGKMIVTFMDADFRERTRLRIPDGWFGSGGGLGASCDIGADCGAGEICKNHVCRSAGSTGSVGATGDPCNIGADCGDGELCDMATHTCRAAGSGEIPTGGVRDCNSSKVIMDVQNALLANGQKLPKYGADGSWGCESEAALKASGMPFAYWAQGCDGAVPTATGCGGGGDLPVPTKKKEGEACTESSQCEAGLECINGKCAKPGLSKTAEKSNLIWWILGGLGAGAAIVGMAYAGGAFDDKGKAKKAAAA